MVLNIEQNDDLKKELEERINCINEQSSSLKFCRNTDDSIKINWNTPGK